MGRLQTVLTYRALTAVAAGALHKTAKHTDVREQFLHERSKCRDGIYEASTEVTAVSAAKLIAGTAMQLCLANDRGVTQWRVSRQVSRVDSAWQRI